MPGVNPIRPVTKSEREQLAAQQIACRIVVKGVESALFQYGLGFAEPEDAAQSAIQRQSAQIVREILGSWRATLDILAKLEQKNAWPDVETLEGWMQLDPELSNAMIGSSARFESQQ